MLRDGLAVGRWAGGGGAIESWGVSAGEIQPSFQSTSPFRTAQTTTSCLLSNPSLYSLTQKAVGHSTSPATPHFSGLSTFGIR